MTRWAPNLGGWLTIFDCFVILAIVLLVQHRVLPDEAIFALYILTLPVGWLALLPPVGGPSADGIIIACIVVGMNSFLWGYGLAGIIRWFRRVARFASRSGSDV